MTCFRIVLGNHPNMMSALSPLARYLQAALTDAGHPTHITYNELVLDGVALLFEGFADDESVAALKAYTAAGGAMGIVCADQMSHDGINMVGGRPRESDYPALPLEPGSAAPLTPQARFARFCELAPLSHFIWCLDADSVDPVRALAGHDQVAHLQFGHLRNFLEVPMLPLAMRPYDFGFFGRPSEHRLALVRPLKERGYNVFLPTYTLPHFLKLDLMSRIKIQLCLPPEAGWPLANSHSLAFNLNNNAFQLASGVFLKEFDQFIPNVATDSFVDHCISALENQEFFTAQLRSFKAFEAQRPMLPFMQAALRVVDGLSRQ